MNNYARQQHPECAVPGVPPEKCEDGQQYVNDKARSVGTCIRSEALLQRGEVGTSAGESAHRSSDHTIPSGDIEHPSEYFDAEDAVEYALARRYSEPLRRHTAHNSPRQRMPASPPIAVAV